MRSFRGCGGDWATLGGVHGGDAAASLLGLVLLVPVLRHGCAACAPFPSSALLGFRGIRCPSRMKPGSDNVQSPSYVEGLGPWAKSAPCVLLHFMLGLPLKKKFMPGLGQTSTNCAQAFAFIFLSFFSVLFPFLFFLKDLAGSLPIHLIRRSNSSFTKKKY